jgi:peptidoglycan hydrolase-like protein with peptidoglycan-binding domain
MMRNLLPKTKIFVALLTLSAVLFACFPITAFAAERYQILKIGDKDDYVLALQTKLKELGFFSGNTTGYFGTKTQQAVIDYQLSHSLKTDGKAGPETLASIMGDEFEISPQERIFASGDTNADYPQPGDKGTAVSELQSRLNDLEYYDYPSITGYYGPVTEQAIISFQNTNGLKADGIAGPETMALLNSENAKSYCIYPGDRGDDVLKLQLRLSELGYFSGTATGYFGTVTADALKEFQAQNELVVDAKAGKNTRSRLFSDDAVSWDGTDRVVDETTRPQTESETDKMLVFANEQLGKPYVYASEGPSSFDCSGFVYYVLKYMGVSTKRCSADGFSKIENWTKINDRNALIPGDILFFQSDGNTRISHAGIYLGDNTFIHASSSNASVIVSSMSDYYDRNFTFARRIY